MKFSAAIVMAATMASASAMSVTPKNAAKVMRSARRLEDGNGNADDYSYLSNYNLKLIGCKAGETVIDPESGAYEYNAAIFRLCPTDSGCDSDSRKGCSAKYGDFVVGLGTFVDAYFEDQKDNMQWDDMFQVDKYAECSEYQREAQGDDQAEDPYANYQFFIGPTCTSDGKDVKLGIFEDDVCTYESSVTFEDIANGWSLPFSTGGLVSTSCLDCVEYNDNGEAQLREMCQNTYMSAASSCETNMEYYSYYGQNVQGCEYITELMPAEKKKGSAGKVFGWIIFIGLIVGLSMYIVWWRKKKNSASDIA